MVVALGRRENARGRELERERGAIEKERVREEGEYGGQRGSPGKKERERFGMTERESGERGRVVKKGPERKKSWGFGGGRKKKRKKAFSFPSF